MGEKIRRGIKSNCDAAIDKLFCELNFFPPSMQTAEVPLDDYSKGVVFYHNNDGRIVGVLTWNLFGKMDVARKVNKALHFTI